MTLFDGDVDPTAKIERDAALAEGRRRMQEARGEVGYAVDRGVAQQGRADEHAHPGWKYLADRAIRVTAEVLPQFTADDVWEVGGLPTTTENRALGPRMAKAARDGLIEDAGRFVKSRQAQCNGMPRRVWLSRIYQEDR